MNRYTGTVLSLADQASAPYDLLTTIYGAVANDELGYSLGAGDIDGDGRQDLILSAVGASPLQRTAAGQMLFYFGRSSFDRKIDARTNEPELVVYGAGISDALGISAFGKDVNQDNYADALVGAPGVDGPAGSGRTDAGALYVISPIDADGDGVRDLADTCPGLNSTNQTDTDSDSLGDLCDNCLSQWSRLTNF